MMNRQELIRKLYESRIMRTTAEVKSFEEAQRALHAMGDPAVLSDLFNGFDDSTEHLEVMWGLVHTVEAFDLETYIRELAMATPKMFPQAKDWALLLHQRLLKTEADLAIYRKILPAVPAKPRKAIKAILEEIKSTSPELSKAAQELLKEVKGEVDNDGTNS
jgi:hypothetical protein